MKNRDSILAKIWLKIVCILVAPAAVIHIAYQVWYFRNYMIKSGPKSKPGENPNPQKNIIMNHYRKSIEKLMSEGYTLLRLGNVKEAKGWPVTYSDSTTGYGNWRIYDYYDTKALRDNVVNRLVTEERYLVL